MTNVSSAYLSTQPGWIGSSDDGLGFKLFHGQFGYGGTHVYNMNLFKIITQEEMGIYEAKHQYGDDMLGGQRGSVVKLRVLL